MIVKICAWKQQKKTMEILIHKTKKYHFTQMSFVLMVFNGERRLKGQF